MLSFVAVSTGKRPSELIEWNDEEDWMERLMFDVAVLEEYYKESEKQWQRARRKV